MKKQEIISLVFEEQLPLEDVEIDGLENLSIYNQIFKQAKQFKMYTIYYNGDEYVVYDLEEAYTLEADSIFDLADGNYLITASFTVEDPSGTSSNWQGYFELKNNKVVELTVSDFKSGVDLILMKDGKPVDKINAKAGRYNLIF